MVVLLVFTMFFFYFYSIVFLIIIIGQFARQKSTAWVLVIVNSICIALFIYLQGLVDNHQLVFRGMYEDASMHWGKGLANVYLTLENNLILILLFSLTQVVFWIMYRRNFKRAADRRQIETRLD